MERRILFVASSFSHIRNFHLPYINAFNERGFKVDVACGGEEMYIPGADRIIRLPFEKSMSSPKNFRAAKILRALMPEYELLSLHTSLTAFFARFAALGLRKRPLICNIAHGYLFDSDSSVSKRAVLSAAEKLTAPVTDLLLTMNQWDYEYAVSHRLGKRIANIPGMGVDYSKAAYTSEQAEEFRHSQGLEGRFVMTYAAEFSARKSQRVLIEAMPLLPDKAVLALPGRGALRDECMALAQKLCVGDRVLFPGQVDNVPLWYLASDAAVSSSRSEGLPFNIMEAMHAALPVVASNVKGHTDLLDNGCGMLYPYGDSAAFADAVKKLMADGELCRHLGESARAEAEQYGLKKVLPVVMGKFDELLEIP